MRSHTLTSRHFWITPSMAASMSADSSRSLLVESHITLTISPLTTHAVIYRMDLLNLMIDRKGYGVLWCEKHHQQRPESPTHSHQGQLSSMSPLMGGTDNTRVYGIYSPGTTTVASTSSIAIRASTINVVSTGTGRSRGIYATGDNLFTIRDTDVYASGTSGITTEVVKQQMRFHN